MDRTKVIAPTVMGTQDSVQHWIPAGPAMDTLTMPVFVNPNQEITQFSANPSPIDLTDTPIDPNNFLGQNYLTTPSPVSPGFYEIEFNLAQNHFWGCDMSFGNSACGKEIRQGIAHLIDKKQFVTTELGSAGAALDDPVPNNSGGLPGANPCNWDPHFIGTTNCIVDPPGGTAYHIQAATGVIYSWQPALGSPDFCAAATHFVNAGLASGKDSTTCVLTGLSPNTTCPNAACQSVDFFIRIDNSILDAIGKSIQGAVCALFTGSFLVSCPQFTGLDEEPISNFPGFATSTTSVNISWWMYTAGVDTETLTNPLGGEQSGSLPIRDPFDTWMFFSYNSQFVSGISSIRQPNGPCSPNSVATGVPANYAYMCVANYDAITNQMEFAPCLSATGDPTTGQTTPTFANCPNTTQLTAISAGYQAEDQFGQGEFAIPIYYPTNQYVYLNGWTRVINSYGGIASYFTYLDAYNPNVWGSPRPSNYGTLRQGVSNQGVSLNPFAASTYTDMLTLGQIYDTLGSTNPTSETIWSDWMTIKTDTIPLGMLSYAAPAGTISAFRLTLRNDIYFHDANKVSAFDVAFSYLSGMAVGVGGATAMITGIAVLSPTQVDVDVSAVGPFTKFYLTAQNVLPGRYWSSSTTSYGQHVDNCGSSAPGCFTSQYTVNSGTINCTRGCIVTATDMKPDPTRVASGFDPVANNKLIGSGPWVCMNPSTGKPGSGCTSSGTMTVPPGGSYTLQRFGKAITPGGSLNGAYFRSSGNLALWIWSQDRGVFSKDFLNFGGVSLCFGQPLGTSGCGVWQHGIGNGAGGTVGLTQVSIVQRFVGVNWVSPFDWVSNAPQGIATFPPVLYEGANPTLNPGSVAGCVKEYNNGGGYDC